MELFASLEEELLVIEKKLSMISALTLESISQDRFLEVLNQSSFLITIHDVEFYRPLLINEKMRHFYGFDNCRLKGIDYFYYLQTIHTSTYHTLVESIAFFRKNKEGFLNLKYRLKNYEGKWIDTIGSSKTIVWDHKKKTKIAITVMEERSFDNKAEIMGAGISSLTHREREIAMLLVSGLSKKEIADQLFISVATVETHTKKLYKKLGINKIVELTQMLDIFQASDPN